MGASQATGTDLYSSVHDQFEYQIRTALTRGITAAKHHDGSVDNAQTVRSIETATLSVLAAVESANAKALPSATPRTVPVRPVYSRWNPDRIEYVVPSEDPTHLLRLDAGDVFTVLAERDRTEGRGGRYEAGHYTDLASAIRGTANQGVQGGPGKVVLQTLTETVTQALDADGILCDVAVLSGYVSVRWEGRLHSLDGEPLP